jgi:predicted lipid-binding transport protein (Tim44 family)
MGACIGPLIASTFMQLVGNSMLYGFMALCTLLLFLRLTHVNYQQKQQDKEVSQDYVMASGDLVSSPLAAALDPRVDAQMVQEQMVSPHHPDAELPTADQELSSMDPEPASTAEIDTVEAITETAPDINKAPDQNKPA